MGNSTVHEYDEYGNNVAIRDALGGIERFAYNEEGDVIRRTDALGNVTTYLYNYDDRGGYVVTETDPLGYSLTQKIDENGNILYSRDSFGNVEVYTYTGGALSKVIDARGNVYEIDRSSGAYKLNGVDVQQINSVGEQVRSITDANGTTKTYTYDSSGRITEERLWVTDTNGNRTEVVNRIEYDTAGRVTKMVSADGSFTEFTYNEAGQVIRAEDHLGLYQEYNYDAVGNLIFQRFTDGSTESYTYDALGRLTSITSNGETTTIVHDALGREKEVIFANGTKNIATYDAVGNLLRVDYADGSFEEKTYDAKGNVLTFKTSSGLNLKYTYRSDGAVETFTDTDGSTYRFTYNSLGDLIQTEFPDGTVKQSVNKNSQRALGEPIKVSNEAGHSYIFQTSKNNQITGIVAYNGSSQSYQYDELGRLISETSFAGRTTKYEYDLRGRRTSRTLSTGQREEYTYNVMDEVTSFRDVSGNTTLYEYDDQGRLVKSTLADNSTVVYNYNADGFLASITSNAGTQSYEYDADGNLVKVTDVYGNITQYSYDSANLTTSVKTISGTTTYSYDTDGKLVRVNDTKLGNILYSYYADGTLKTRTLPNGVVETYTWDTKTGLLASWVQTTGTSTIASYVYTRDNIGNVVRIDENVGLNSERIVHYEYDGLNRLILERIHQGVNTRNISYEYDNDGNLLKRNDSVDGLTTYTYGTSGLTNGLLLTSTHNGVTTTYTYDTRGNRIRESSSLGIKEYDWNVLNRLVGIRVKDGHGQILHTFSYTYDAQGNRISETKDGVTTKFVLDYSKPYVQVREAIQSSGVSNYYVSDGSITPIAQVGLNNTSFYLGDRQGSTKVKLDQSGAVTDRFVYDAYGRIISPSIISNSDDYLYAGESYSPTTGLQYLRFRYRDVNTGSFISRDTYEGDILDPLSRNQYLYAKANPVTYTDPTGHFSLAEFAASEQVQKILNNLQTTQRIDQIKQLTKKVESFVSVLWIAGVITELLADYLASWPFNLGGITSNLIGGAGGNKSGIPGAVQKSFKPPKPVSDNWKKFEYGWGPGLSVVKDKESLDAIGIKPEYAGFFGAEANDEDSKKKKGVGGVSGSKLKVSVGAALKLDLTKPQKSSLDFKIGFSAARDLTLYEDKVEAQVGSSKVELTKAKITFGVETKIGVSGSTSTKVSYGQSWNLFFSLALGQTFVSLPNGKSVSKGAAFKYKVNLFQIGFKHVSQHKKGDTAGIYLGFLGGTGDVLGSTSL